ncbi:methionine adenosyltransferase [Streptomyces sp. SR27]|uniref:methionine adenosyltransferase n=2 Tax=unclassified Streptomyces TaxID=2593676 RepID=UPI00295B3E45|nr:methionine adenosyltransferase [Streptomyces sp. SR27]MDV9188678.1 methionine adenosyltransferase [Streptomyces sp. SR27]
MHHAIPIDDTSMMFIQTNVPTAGAVSIVERKGLGHPDTLADQLAEHLSQGYSRYTLEQFGVVLHHNFDKLALLGGSSEVRYGAGRMLDPVRVLVNGRAAHRCGEQTIPVEDIVGTAVVEFFEHRLPELGGHLAIEFNITGNASPGSVITDAGTTERSRWFAPKSAADLRERKVRLSNDTSLGTGWAPLNPFESFVRVLADTFSGAGDFTSAHPWCGSDVKVMGYADEHRADVVLCVPQKSAHVATRAEYLANKDVVLAECDRLARVHLPQLEVAFRLNARDIPEKDELYLTYTGSSIESGDEGVVGRGNRVNGLITPLRPMNMEGANGKNPVYHIGKLYNVAATRLAQRIHEETGEYAEVHLISATGQPLDRPWRVLVRLAAEDPQLDKIQRLTEEILAGFPALTDEFIGAGVLMS